MQADVVKLASCVERLAAALTSLKRFESTFSPDAKKLFQESLAAVDKATKATASGQDVSDTPSFSAYLLSGSSTEGLKAAQAQLQQCLTAILAGGVPVPRSSKEDLTNLKAELLAIKVEAPAGTQLKDQLRSLYRNATEGKGDVDVVEAKLDDVVRQLTATVYNGATTLSEEDLRRELQALKDSITRLQSSGSKSQEEDAALLSLLVNSLERLHSVFMVDEDSEEEEEEAVEEPEDEDDDDDDPFFMPLPSALKLADASKFSELAKPIKEADSPFMIAMDEESASIGETDGSMTSGVATLEPSPAPILTDMDFVPVQAKDDNTDAAKMAAAGLAALSIPSPKDATSLSRAMSPVAPAVTEDGQAAKESGEAAAAAPAGEEAAAAAAAGALTVAGAAGVPTPTPGSPQPTDEKLSQFVNFLHGENPGACQFHAQMRLSHEGCRKLSVFIKSSGRVRALSLSHNLIGDEGLRILCEGLSTNKSVTALDLPDNDISDEGILQLSLALKRNVSLTQLQLAYNRIGNDGAVALAKLISESQSLKKVGLSHNRIGKAGCQALTAAISSNQSLNHLQLLPGNPVEEKDAKALAKALKRNKKFSIRSLLGTLVA